MNIKKRRHTQQAQLKALLHKNFSHYIKVFFLVFILGLGLWFVYFLIVESDIFKISKVEIVGAEKYVNEIDILTMASSAAKKTNILFFKESMLQQNLRKNFEGAKEIEVIKELPSKLTIIVHERKPVAVIRKPDSTDNYIIDSDGYVLGSVIDSVGLPVISYSGDIKTGTYIDKNLIPSYLELIDYLSQSNLKVSSLSFYPKYSEFYLNNAIQVLIGNDKNKQAAVALLKNLLNQSEDDKQKVKKVDLRYEKVIVSY